MDFQTQHRFSPLWQDISLKQSSFPLKSRLVTSESNPHVKLVFALSLAQVPMGWRFRRARHWIRIHYQGLAAGEQKHTTIFPSKSVKS